MSVIGPALCSECGSGVFRVLWNYAKGRPVENFFCNAACKGVWQRKRRELLGFTKEWLVDQYIVKGRSSNDIAREIGRDPKRVWEWIRDYGISTRTRGHNTSQLPKDGSPFRGKKHSEEFKIQKRIERLADGRKPYLKNGVHWLKLPGSRSPNWKGGITPERQALYGSLEWRSVAAKVRKRDRSCVRCKEYLHGKMDIHHIDGFSVRERRAVLDNLVLLCEPCHMWVHGTKNIGREYLGKGH